MNKVIIFGNGLNNTLGLIRSIGEAGMPVYLLLVSKDPHRCYVQYSKYIAATHYCHTQEEGLEVLRREYWDEREKPILLFGGDPPVCLVDSHYNELKERFLFFNAGEQGRISRFLDKMNTFPVAEKCGFSLIKTWHVLGGCEIPSDVTYPCLIKGANSTTSNKGHMRICQNELELKQSLCVDVDYLVQEYLIKDYELNFVGLAWNHGKGSYVPAVVRKIRDDLHRQSVYIRLDDIRKYRDFNIEWVKDFIKELHYEGIFSVEVIKSGGKYYFLEVNLRNDACGYLYTAAGINYPALWVKYCRDELSKDELERIQFKTPYYLMNWEDHKNMLEGKVPVLQWIREYMAVDAYFVRNRKDRKPFLVAFKRDAGRLSKMVLKKIWASVFSRGKVQRLLAVVGYYLGIDSLFYRLNRKAKRIVTFHNVLPDEIFRNDGTNGVSCSESQFRMIVGDIAKKYRFSNDLLDANTATITFDDGYCNQYDCAFRCLKEMGIPGIVFASGDALKAKTPAEALIVDRLLFWKSYAPQEILDREFGAGLTRNEVWSKFIRPEYAADTEAKGANVVKRLDALYPFAKIWSELPEEYLRQRLCGISGEQLDEMRKAGWLVCWHTQSHFPLSGLSREEVNTEVTPPDDFVGLPFSFPFGERMSVSDANIDMVKQSGYPCAVSNMEYSVMSPDRYFLPRFYLAGDKYNIHFLLSGFKFFLDTLHLLPGGHLE